MTADDQIDALIKEVNTIKRYIGMPGDGDSPPPGQPEAPDAEDMKTPPRGEGQAENTQMPFSGEAPLKDRRKKARRIASMTAGFFFYTFLAAAIAAAFFLGGGNGRPRAIGNYSIMTVLTGSMNSVIPQGSIVAIKQIDPGEIKVGDDVTYLREDNTTVTHRVISITENYGDSGMRGFQLQGTDNPLPDPDIVYANNMIGRVTWHSAFFGRTVSFLRQNWIFAVALVGILLALTVTLRVYFAPAKDKPGHEPPLDNPTSSQA